MDQKTQAWEQATIEKLLLEGVKEQRRRRRWGIFFKLTYLFLLVIVLWSFLQNTHDGFPDMRGKHTALIDIKGMIADNSDFSADNITRGLRRAFKDKDTTAVLLRINSPGGTPVQSAFVYNEIKRLRKNYPKVKVYAACTDICASGAYYIAAAADEIYANESSLVGSIGVLLNGFGFVDTMKKVGVERRLITAGTHKGFLDPFSPVKPYEKTFIKHLLNDVHQQFIKDVLLGRGSRLKRNDKVFSGLVWSGSEAKAMGLIDGIGSPGSVARDIIKNENVVDFTIKPDYFRRFSKYIGASFANGLMHTATQVDLR